MGVLLKDGRYILRWTNGIGKRAWLTSKAETKTEAKRLLRDLQRQAERQRLGLEPLPTEDGGGTVAELLQWWLDTISQGSPSHANNVSVVGKHYIRSELASLPLTAVTPQHIEALLLDKSRELSPETINKLRGLLSRAFNAARRVGRFNGPNPVAGVKKHKVPHRLPDYLRAEEVPLVLATLAPQHRSLFATAIFTGLRKGELAGLLKTDVDLKARLLTVQRSYDRDTTKGGHADVIPIAAELVPYLEQAISDSPSQFVFPASDGGMLSRHLHLERVLRRALGRAGIATGWKHVCRRKGCGHVEKAPDAALRRCPADGRKLWPKPEVRPIRFHDTRHTTGSLSIMAGAALPAVSKLLRHKDPKLTMALYAHLAPEYLRAEVDRLSFRVKPAEGESVAQPARAVNAAVFDSDRCKTVQTEPDRPIRIAPLRKLPDEIQAVRNARDEGVEPTTFGSGGQRSIQLS